MPPIDPRLVKAKRFPVHAAVDRCNENEVYRLVDADAEFHLGRKMPDTELSVLHTACSERLGPQEVIVKILKYLVKMNAPLNDPDSIGQSPLHYAVCNTRSEFLVPALIEQTNEQRKLQLQEEQQSNSSNDESKTNVLNLSSLSSKKPQPPIHLKLDVQRMTDGWTALHLAVVFGRAAAVRALLKAGADPCVETGWGEDAQDLARLHRQFQIADLISSPRRYHHPKSTTLPAPLFTDLLKKMSAAAEQNSILKQLPNKPLPTPIKLKEEEIAWRDDQGNSMLHIAAWDGDIKLARVVLDSIKGRKMAQVQNEKGATPLAMAIIAGQDSMIEEFFMHKHAKKVVEFSPTLKGTQQNIVHLLLQYAPYVPPKFILKRKDLTKETLNALDVDGNTPMLKIAMRNSRNSLRRVFASKNVKDHSMLELQHVNKFGRNVLHYLIEYRDRANFHQILDRAELTPEIANAPNGKGDTPLMMLLKMSMTESVCEILKHEEAKDKFKFDVVHQGQTILHIIASLQPEDVSLWGLATSRPDINLNAQDSDGNSPLMKAAECGKLQLVGKCVSDPEFMSKVDLGIVNKEGNNLLMLCIIHMDEGIVKTLISFSNLRPHINMVNANQNSALLLAALLNHWSILQFLLETPRLRDEKDESCVDVHLANEAGHTCIVFLILARIKLARLEQTHMMKKERSLAARAKKEHDFLWEQVKLILMREKELHGPTMVQGRDGGSACIKKQLAAHKLIRSPTPDSVTAEYTKLYNVMLQKKKSIGKQMSRQESKTEEESQNETDDATPANDGPEQQAKTADVVNGGEGNAEAPATPDTKPVVSKAIPLISLETLSNPAALEAAIGKAAEKIEMEKKKIGGVKKKKSPKKKKALPEEAAAAEPKEIPKEVPKVEEPVKQPSPERRPKSLHIEDPKEGNNDIASKAGVKQRPKSAHLTVEDAEVADLNLKREWSPTPAPRTRRTSSFRNGRGPSPSKNGGAGGDPSGEKPPIPSGPSPPPPDEPPSVTAEASAAAALNIDNGTVQAGPPKRNDMINGHLKSATPKSPQEPRQQEEEVNGPLNLPSSSAKAGSKIGLAWKRLNSTPEEEAASADRQMFGNTKKLIQSRSKSYISVETSEAWTQTEDTIPAASGTVRACCCDCHKNLKKNSGPS